jgi:hypothetical protein
MEIDKKIIKQASDQLKGHLEQQRDRINGAYSNNAEILEIGLKARFSYVKNKFKIKTEINFVESRLKDTATTWYDPKQKQFSFDEPEAGAPGYEE